MDRIACRISSSVVNGGIWSDRILITSDRNAFVENGSEEQTDQKHAWQKKSGLFKSEHFKHVSRFNLMLTNVCIYVGCG